MAHRTHPTAATVTAVRAQVVAAQSGTLAEAKAAATAAMALAEDLALYVRDIQGRMSNGGLPQDPIRYLSEATTAWGLT